MAYITKPTTLMKIWATSGVKEVPADSKIQQGWVVELPPYQYDNWLENRQDTFIAHVNQVGIPVWDSATEYQGNKSYAQGSNGAVYKALATSVNIDPTNPLNSAYWVRAFEDYGSVQVVQNALNAHLTNYSTLAGIGNVVAARSNLSVYSKAESDAKYAIKQGSASQTFSVAVATADDHAINRGQFLSLLNQSTESSAGIAEIADQSEMNVGTDDTRIVTPKKAKSTFLMRANNLSDLTNIGAAKVTLGIKDVGTTAGTVAAGDDPRIVGAVQTTRNIAAGNGLVGGGALAADVTLSVGTPSTVNSTSTNMVTADSHTHALDISSFFSNRIGAADGYYVLPGGYSLQWGIANNTALNDDQSVSVVLHLPGTILNVQVTAFGTPTTSIGPCFMSSNWGTTSFTVSNNYGTGAYPFRWFAVVLV